MGAGAPAGSLQQCCCSRACLGSSTVAIHNIVVELVAIHHGMAVAQYGLAVSTQGLIPHNAVGEIAV